MQNLSSVGIVLISEGTNPLYHVGGVLANQALIQLPEQYDWFEANKALGWNTESVWYIWGSTTAMTAVINEGLEDPPVTARSAPVSRPM